MMKGLKLGLSEVDDFGGLLSELKVDDVKSMKVGRR